MFFYSHGQDFLSLFTSDKRISDCGKPYKQPPRDCVRFRADRKVKINNKWSSR